MEEDMVEEDEFVEAVEIDWDYEFDAAQFFDFTRQETHQDSLQAEFWFQHAGDYPASPLANRFKWRNEEQNGTTTSLDSASDGSRVSSPSKAKSSSCSSRQWSSTLLRPTLSHVAKLKNTGDMLLSEHLCGRYQKSLVQMEEKGCLYLAPKRQKIEVGYLLKGSRMKHQPLLLHKDSKKDGNATPDSKMKVTVPKEPALETMQRAKVRSFRSRTNSEVSERSELDTQTLKKTIKPSSLTPTVKSKQKPTEVQAFNFMTTARALQRSSASELSRHGSDISSVHSIPADWKRSNLNDAVKKKKFEKPLKTKTETIITISQEESELEKNNRLSECPPTDLFSKLSLRCSNAESVTLPKSCVSSKGSKENAPYSFQPDFWKMNQCGSGGFEVIVGIGHQSSMNRSLGIR